MLAQIGARSFQHQCHKCRSDRDFRDHTASAGSAISTPAFGNSYSDEEIAAAANYVTSRFGSKGSHLTAQDVAVLRKQTSE
jgi:mono/diheme cytochrome c family protein